MDSMPNEINRCPIISTNASKANTQTVEYGWTDIPTNADHPSTSRWENETFDHYSWISNTVWVKTKMKMKIGIRSLMNHRWIFLVSASFFFRFGFVRIEMPNTPFRMHLTWRHQTRVIPTPYQPMPFHLIRQTAFAVEMQSYLLSLTKIEIEHSFWASKNEFQSIFFF